MTLLLVTHGAAVSARVPARAQLYNPKTSVGYNLGKVTVWPPTQPNQFLQMYSLCQVQVNLAIPAGEYNVRPAPHTPAPALAPAQSHRLRACAASRSCTVAPAGKRDAGASASCGIS